MCPGGLPFAHLNLRRNPFGELTPEERAELAVVDVDRFVDRLREPRFALQIVGDCGRGKTTHLLALWARFPRAPYVHVFEGEKPDLPEAEVLFVDDVDQVPTRRRRRLFRRPGSLAMTTHRDLSEELRRAERAFETIDVAGVGEERLLQITERRIEWARRGPGAVPVVGPEGVRRLLERFGDDLRAIEFHLYERFQEMEEVDHVPV